VWNLILLCSSCHQAHHDRRLMISGTADQLKVTRPTWSHVGPASPLADAIARTQAKTSLVRLGWKAGEARAAVDRVTSGLPPDATAEAILRAVLELDPATSHVGPTSPPDTQRARDGTGLTWNARLAS
jgi:hypothetical protein